MDPKVQELIDVAEEKGIVSCQLKMTKALNKAMREYLKNEKGDNPEGVSSIHLVHFQKFEQAVYQAIEDLKPH